MTNDENRKNDPARIPKQPTRLPGAFRHWDFGFLLPFVIRHWSLTTLGSALALAVSCSKPAANGARPEAEEAVPVTAASVDLLPMDQSLDIWGTLYAKDEATLGAEVEGKVEKTLVDFGDRITAGQELALIDTTTYEALARQAEANMAKAKASARNAELTLTRARSCAKTTSPRKAIWTPPWPPRSRPAPRSTRLRRPTRSRS